MRQPRLEPTLPHVRARVLLCHRLPTVDERSAAFARSSTAPEAHGRSCLCRTEHCPCQGSGMFEEPRDALYLLQWWYLAQCNDAWEHFGVGIGTLDNPGWSVRVELTDTSLEAETRDW